MAYHFRSQSEQYQPQVQPAVLSQQPQQTIESFTLEHTDSQLSLDRLFNPPTSPSVRPLRGRNLPRSFFTPGLKPAGDGSGDGTTPTNNGTPPTTATTNHLHTRSMSYGQQPQPRLARAANHHQHQNVNNFHMRTHSLIAPMPEHSSGHSSLEGLDSVSSTSINTSGIYEPPPLAAVPAAQPPAIMPINGNTQHQPVAGRTDWSMATNTMEHHHNGLSNDGVNYMNSAHRHQQQQQQQQPRHSLGSLSELSPHPSVELIAHPPPTMPTVSNNQQPNNFYGLATANNSMHNNYNTASTTNNFHHRSMSYDQHRPTHEGLRGGLSNHHNHQNNLHSRTHSTLAPMASAGAHLGPAGYQTSTSTSREFLNYTANNQSATGWSSSGYSSDDMTAAVNNGNFWVAPGGNGGQTHQNNQQANYHQHHQQQPQPMQTSVGSTTIPVGAPPASIMGQTTPTQQQAFPLQQEGQVFYEI